MSWALQSAQSHMSSRWVLLYSQCAKVPEVPTMQQQHDLAMKTLSATKMHIPFALWTKRRWAVSRSYTDQACASCIWQGQREYKREDVVQQLGLGSAMPARKGGPGQPALPMQGTPGSRFILPISECEFTINAVLDELQRDAFPTLSEFRPSRCTGTAIQVPANSPWQSRCTTRLGMLLP